MGKNLLFLTAFCLLRNLAISQTYDLSTYNNIHIRSSLIQLNTSSVDWANKLHFRTIDDNHYGDFSFEAERLSDGSIRELLHLDGGLNKVTTPQIEIVNSGEWAELLRLSTDRPWVFRQTSSGSTAQLDLHSTSSDKHFKITSTNNYRAVEFKVSDYAQSNRVLLAPDGGRVGIGTDSPSEKLDLNGNIKLNQSGNKIYWDWSDRTIEQYSSDGSSQMIRFKNSMNSSNPDGGFDFATHEGTSVLRINQGKVGIGTTDFSGTHKLRVEGSIGAREIKVEGSGWSDFVFEKGYNLRTLEEVEEHISEKGHLPEIPSEAEVTENGINLGEMNAKLLQKIEELTLYLIEQNKRMNRLEVKNEELEKEISILKNQ